MHVSGSDRSLLVELVLCIYIICINVLVIIFIMFQFFYFCIHYIMLGCHTMQYINCIEVITVVQGPVLVTAVLVFLY